MPNWSHKADLSTEEYAVRKKYFQAPYLVLQIVTNRGLYSVPGRTKWYLEGPGGPQDAYHGPSRYHLVLPGTQ